MDVVSSTHVQRWHLDPANPVLIQLQTRTFDGTPTGVVAAVLSPVLAEELGVALSMQAAADFETPTGPDPQDVEQVTALLDLMADFPSNEQRARYLLTCNWLRDRGAAAAALSARQLDALRARVDVPVGS